MKRVLLSFAIALSFASRVWAQPALGDVSLEADSRYMWRGYNFGSGITFHPQVKFGLFGRSVTATGLNSIDGDVQAWIPASGDASNSGTIAEASLRYARTFSSRHTTEVWSRITERHIEDASDSLSTELAAGAETEIRWQEQGLSSLHPYVEVTHDFQTFDATYVRAGLRHSIRAGELISIDLDGFYSASDYAGARGERDFGHHATEFSAWATWTVPEIRFGRPVIGVGAGKSWTAKDVGPDGSWIGMQLKIVR